MTPAIQIFAGKTALAHIKEHGLRAQDIAVIPAAAGGPKGLILQALDQWLFGEWLPSAPRERSLIGASIGAWRMAAACHAQPMDAFKKLGDLYCEQQYSPKPTAKQVTAEIQRLLSEFISGHEEEILSHPHHHLHLLAVRGRGLLQSPRHAASVKAGFAAATIANLRSRSKLAKHLDRVVIGDQRDPLFWMKAKFDAFDTHFAPLSTNNLSSSLLASGTLPIIMDPVRQIAEAPTGTYWDGGIIDYHLALPFHRVAGDKEGGLVLYPHFTDRIVPGWLDKALPWRHARHSQQKHWLDNVIMVAPSEAFLKILPFGKLPDRNDFKFYGKNHRLRIQSWKLSIAASHYMRDALATFVERPNWKQIKPLNF